MPYSMGTTDSTAALQTALDTAASTRAAYTLPAGGFRLLSTGLGYSSNARIILVGDLYNDHGPAVGTHYCLTNRTTKRLSNVTIQGQGGAFVGASSFPAGATRKGLGIVATDGFTVTGAQTRGPLTGFGMEIKHSTGGHLDGLILLSGVNKQGADGLHFFGACNTVAGSTIRISSGDDALSFTHEFQESFNAVMERITLTDMTLDSAAFSCIKFYTGPETGKSTIRNIRLSNIKGQITAGPTGCPLAMQNNGAVNGAMIDNVVIDNADLTFGRATTQDGPTAFLTDITNLHLTNVKLRGRRRGQFIRAIRCKGLFVTGEVWETIPGSSAANMIQLEQCGNYNIDLIVRSAAGTRLGSIKAVNSGTDTGIEYIGMTGS
jgi:hypothetical protein